MVNLEAIKSHADWSLFGGEAVELLALGQYWSIIDQGLATSIGNDFGDFDGLLDDALASFDKYADMVGFEL
jgi:hypothetical protein